jgi:hypothetical protein
MSRLSITTAWNETAAFVRREAGLLFSIALALIAFPGVVMEAATPAAAPGQPPEPGAWALLYLPLVFVTMLGTVAISSLALGREQVVGPAIKAASRRILPLFGAALLLGLLVALIAVPFMALFGVAMLAGAGLSGAVLLGWLVLILLLCAIFARFLVLNPLAADKPLGPVALLRQSWALTRGHFWRLLGLVFTLLLVFGIITMAATAVFGSLLALAAGPAEHGSLAWLLLLLVMGVLNAVITTYITVLTARIYVQLAEGQRTSGI